MLKEKIMNLIHMAVKARKVTFGCDAVIREATKEGLLILALDVSDRTKKKINNEISNKWISLCEWGQKQWFSTLNGKEVGVIYINDRNFAQGIIRLINQYVAMNGGSFGS